MTRNQKIALGCGGAGCLGLIVVVIAVALIFYFSMSGFHLYGLGSDPNSNTNVNTANRNSNDNSSSSSSSSSDASSLSDDEKHRLYQAALMTADSELVRRVSVKLGLFNEDYTPGDKWEEFVTDHAGWVYRNTDFIQSISTEEKAREYVNNNIPD